MRSGTLLYNCVCICKCIIEMSLVIRIFKTKINNNTSYVLNYKRY